MFKKTYNETLRANLWNWNISKEIEKNLIRPMNLKLAVIWGVKSAYSSKFMNRIGTVDVDRQEKMDWQTKNYEMEAIWSEVRNPENRALR